MSSDSLKIVSVRKQYKIHSFCLKLMAQTFCAGKQIGLFCACSLLYKSAVAF